MSYFTKGNNSILDSNIIIHYGGIDGVSAGLVFINHFGMRGGLCDSDFTEEDATVICNSAGYLRGQGRCCGQMGSLDPEYPIWIKDPWCLGNESSVIDCSWDGVWGTSECSQEDAVGVICYNDSGKSFVRPTSIVSPSEKS